MCGEYESGYSLLKTEVERAKGGSIRIGATKCVATSASCTDVDGQRTAWGELIVDSE